MLVTVSVNVTAMYCSCWWKKHFIVLSYAVAMNCDAWCNVASRCVNHCIDSLIANSIRSKPDHGHCAHTRAHVHCHWLHSNWWGWCLWMLDFRLWSPKVVSIIICWVGSTFASELVKNEDHDVSCLTTSRQLIFRPPKKSMITAELQSGGWKIAIPIIWRFMRCPFQWAEIPKSSI